MKANLFQIFVNPLFPVLLTIGSQSFSPESQKLMGIISEILYSKIARNTRYGLAQKML